MSSAATFDHRETPSGYRRRIVNDLEQFLNVGLYRTGAAWPRHREPHRQTPAPTPRAVYSPLHEVVERSGAEEAS